MSNPFKSKRKKAAEQKAKEKLEPYIHQNLKRARPARQTYQQRCPHCHGRRMMSNGNPCRNCGGSGTITRFG